jgi:hypothetical protein
MAYRKPKKKTFSITHYLFLLIGAGIVLIVLILWFAVPGWHAQPAGMWALIAAAALGLAGIIKDSIPLQQDLKEIKAAQKPSRPRHHPQSS